VINLVFFIVGLFPLIFSFFWSARAAQYYANETSRNKNNRQRIWIFGQRGRHQHRPSNVSCQQLLCVSDLDGVAIVVAFPADFTKSSAAVATQKAPFPRKTLRPMLTFARVTKIKSMPSKCQCSWRKVLKAETTRRITGKLNPSQVL